MNRSTHHTQQAHHYRQLTNRWTWTALACAAISVITYLAVLAATQPLGTPTTPDPASLHPYIEMNLPATDRVTWTGDTP